MALTTVPASLSATALTLTTAAQPNITSVGTLGSLTVSGAATSADFRSTGIQYFTHATDVRFRTTTGTEVMRIDTSGQVGIGVNNPGQTLEIHNSNASDYTDFGLRGTGHKYVIGVGNASVSTVNDKWYLYDNDNTCLLYTSPSPRDS